MSARKRGLGRGLDALLAGGEPARALPIAALHPSRRQPRASFDEAGLEELAASIRSQGVLQPLLVTPDGDGTYTIIAGERRWRAAQRAGLENVPVVVRELGGEGELLELALIENLQRTDLNPLEEAEAYRTLQQEFGLTQEEIAARVGKSRPTVANAMRLLKLPPEVQELLRQGHLTAGQARPLLALTSAAEQVALARRAVEEGLSARDLERRVGSEGAALEARGAKRPRAPLEPHAAAAAERLTQRLQTRVEIVRRGQGGTVRIHFHSEEELMRLFELLMQRGGRP